MSRHRPAYHAGMRRIVPAAIFSLLALGVGGQAPVPVGTDVGQAFPTGALPGLDDGQPRSVATYRGTKVLLHQFASW